MDIAITGYGIICAIGNNADEVLGSLKELKSGIAYPKFLQTSTKKPVGEVKLTNEQLAKMAGEEYTELTSRTSYLSHIALNQAMLSAMPYMTDGCNTISIVTGTTVGGMDIVEKNNMLSTSVMFTDNLQRGGLERQIQIKEHRIISTACSSGLNAIIEGARMLEEGSADIVIAGAAECLSKFHLNGFNSLMILSDEKCKPFDANRNGLNLGEGAAYVVMQKASKISNLKKPVAYLTGYGNSCDAYHLTATSKNGEGAYRAMLAALSMEDMVYDDITFVCAHGTATPDNDASETEALKRIFTRKMPKITSTKGFTGHTTSAAGAISAVISILAMQNNFIPVNLNWSTPMKNGIIPCMTNKEVEVKNVLCNAFGFGGNESSIVLSKEKYPSYKKYAPMKELCYSTNKAKCHKGEAAYIKDYLEPAETRRMNDVEKMALVSAFTVMDDSNIKCPDAIIAVTSHGMTSYTEQILEDLRNDESSVKPSLFMQCTQNTIASLVAIHTKCHGPNYTYIVDPEYDKLEIGKELAISLIQSEHSRNKKFKNVLLVTYEDGEPFVIKNGTKFTDPEVTSILIHTSNR